MADSKKIKCIVFNDGSGEGNFIYYFDIHGVTCLMEYAFTHGQEGGKFEDLQVSVGEFTEQELEEMPEA